MKNRSRLISLLFIFSIILLLTVIPNHNEAVASTTNLQKQNASLQKTVKELNAKLRAKESENKQLKTKIKTLETKVKTQGDTIKTSQSVKNTLERQVKTLLATMANIDEIVKNLKVEKKDLEENFNGILSVKLELENTVKSLTTNVSQLKTELDALKKGGAKPVEEPPSNSKPSDVNGLTYKGLANVSNKTTNNISTQVHQYTLNLPKAYSINVYVTERYIKEYGEGFGYGEIEAMIDSVEKVRGGKPYEKLNNSLEFFFYVNDRNVTNDDENFPVNVQAQAGSSGNSFSMATTILINGGGFWNMDFRPRILHEIAHYYDAQTFTYKGLNTFGDKASFWFQEGAAEYAAYNYYQYPKNTINGRKLPIIANSRDSIIRYAFEQTKERPVVDQTNLNSFKDLMVAAKNNYGVTNSFYWYLAEMFTEQKVREYINYVDSQPFMNQDQLAAVTLKYFDKNEKEILKGWKEAFPELF